MKTKPVILFFICSLFIQLLLPYKVFSKAAISADDLIYLTENFPPHNYMKNGSIDGVSVEILELIWKKMGVSKTKSDIALVPWARGIKRLENEPNIVLFGMGFSQDRAKKFHWAGPYFSQTISLIAKKEKKIRINTIDDAKAFQIGVVREDIGQQTLLKLGFDSSKLDLSSDIDMLFRLFKYERFDLICYVENVFFDYAGRQDINGMLFETVIQIVSTNSGFGFSKKIPVSLIKQFQTALDQLKEENAIDIILKKHGLE